MTGRITIGIQASGPATMNRTAINRIAKSRSVIADHGAGREELADGIEIPKLVCQHAD